MDTTKTIQNILKWTSRTLNVLILSFILFFLLAHIFGDAEDGNGFANAQEMILFAFFPILTLVGLAIAWKWEMLGGVISFLSILIAITIMNSNLSDLTKEPQFLVIAVPGFLHICHAWMVKRS